MKAFITFIELRTKVASLLPFLLGTALAYYTLETLYLERFFLMLIALLCIDMATTGLNHFYDAKRAIVTTGYHYDEHNPITSGQLNRKRAKRYLIELLLVGSSAGIGLTLLTDPFVLVLGGLSFIIGIVYSAGPLPLSRTILGELFSGLFMGLLITFISFYIQVPNGYLGELSFSLSFIYFSIKLTEALPVVLLGLQLSLMIGNIMLANNICDREEDILNKRFTLPVVMGLQKSVILFKLNTIIAYVILCLGILLKLLPFMMLVTLVTLPIIYKRARIFCANPVKSKTFKLAVGNFLIFASTLLLTLLVSILMK
mgnify:CR=1 FL=1